MNMIIGFSKNNRMEPSTGRRNKIGGVPTRRMRSLSAISMSPSPSGLDCPNLTMGRTRARGLGKGPVPTRGTAPTGVWVPARAVLALLFWVVAERTGCVPTWVVLTCSYGGVTEIDPHRRGRTSAALTSIQCEAREWAYFSRPGGACGDTRGAVVCS